MKLYAAIDAVRKSGTGLTDAVRGGFTHVLVSYAIGRRDTLAVVFEAHRRGIGVFLDSGAFSAFTQGTKIPVGEYIDFCLQVRGLVDVVACLDVIDDRAGTERNQRAMEDAGLEPLVTCHLGDSPLHVVETLRGRKYGALGGMAARSRLNREMRRRWLDDVFRALMASDAWPVRLHGFGMTDSILMERYPWYSVDSTSWAVRARFGNEFSTERTPRAERSRLIPHMGSAAKVARTHRSAPKIVAFADYCTRLWEKRGVVWV